MFDSLVFYSFSLEVKNNFKKEETMSNLPALPRRIFAFSAFSNPIAKEEADQVIDRFKTHFSSEIERGEIELLVMDSMDRFAGFKERADFFNLCFEKKVEYIFDLSGGDLANGLLPYINYQAARKSQTVFVGWSDLCTIENALYVKAGLGSILFHANFKEREKDLFAYLEGKSLDLLAFSYDFLKGDQSRFESIFQSIWIGGNTRCFLKLAGTEYCPDLCGKILFLDSWHGDESKILTLFCQYAQLSNSDKLAGIVLGQFTELSEKCRDLYHKQQLLLWLLKEAGLDAPLIIQTEQIGHAPESSALVLGASMEDLAVKLE